MLFIWLCIKFYYHMTFIIYYLILLVFYWSFVAFIYFLFLVHFCFIFLHLFPFLPFFFFCAKMSLSSTSFAWYYFQFYPYWPLVNPSKGTPTPSELLGKLQSLLPLLLCYYRSWTISTHPPIPVFLRVIHSLRHPSAQGPLFLLMSQENPVRGCQRLYNTRISSKSFDARFCHLLKKVTTVILCRSHHHPFIVVIITKQHDQYKELRLPANLVMVLTK